MYLIQIMNDGTISQRYYNDAYQTKMLILQIKLPIFDFMILKVKLCKNILVHPSDD